jgi:hypothetical protein
MPHRESRQTQSSQNILVGAPLNYDGLLAGIASLLERSRRSVTRSVNAILTATYWEIGRRIVEHEQRGSIASDYGEKLLERLSMDLTARYGRGFSRSNVAQMRAFFASWEIVQTPSGQFQARVKMSSGFPATTKIQTLSGQSRNSLIVRSNAANAD